MRRTVLSFLFVSAAVAAVVACTGRDHASAVPPAGEGSAKGLYREAAATAPAAEVPVGTSLAPLIERLKPAVVNISTTTSTKNPHPGRRGRGTDPFERFFGQPMPDMPEEFKGQSLGSGFILNAEGYILTNNHVVKDATDIRVTLGDNTEYAAKVIGKDPVTDVALIKLASPPKGLPTVVLGDSDALRQGDFVLALGSPFGLRGTATLGIVSAKHRGGVNPGGSGTYDDFIQTDAAINPGNSGGPLFNLKGEVVGINTAIVSPQIGQGIGFAVPISLAKSLLPQLQARGKVTRGYLGVQVSPLTPDLRQAFGLAAGTQGALVQQVMPKTPAAKAGLQPGDVVTTLNGAPIDDAGALTRGVALVPPGEKVTLGVLRNGKAQSFSFVVAQRPEEDQLASGEPAAEEGEAAADAKSPKLGVRLQALTPDLAKELGVQGDQGVLVADVVEGGPAERAGVARGDVIIEANRQPVSKPADLSAIVSKLKDGDLLLLRVRRGDGAAFVAVPVGGRR
ncbi:MAG TPA: trypsin-like peptidase domain-containing protein [Anaeromyxobacteraceae bacterium]|nr:trypsin-like peptidase domain-containing protein [Anaeromyxobacteraceae bacterium]